MMSGDCVQNPYSGRRPHAMCLLAESIRADLLDVLAVVLRLRNAGHTGRGQDRDGAEADGEPGNGSGFRSGR